jgi:hypothetical protein
MYYRYERRETALFAFFYVPVSRALGEARGTIAEFSGGPK